MQHQLQKASKFLEHLQTLSDVNACWDVFLKEAQNLGIPWVLYGFLRVREHEQSQFIYFSSYPPEWQEVYDRLGGPDNDVNVQHCIHSSEELRWYEPKALALLPPEQLEMEKMAQRHGATSGITIPLRGGPDIEDWGGVGYGSNLDNAGFDRLLSESGDYLRLIAQVFHAVIQSRPLAKNIALLTEKEKQVLTLSACGFKTPQIAEKLGINRKTVEQRMARTKVKLSCTTFTQAVAEGMRLYILKI
ncbi:LuxR family transcriptional regulator [Magnetovibrio blakemorei]|uniref:HTH luxR-type domain-containing protein n=1 Tax=Magnetovibrio blakemorei TaxID=28181 RepID=A0A1E5Q7X5_9PROT|nr:LuxR family transcriptional regulator [Magnetovibrio blakemorei]OEJ67349.1 hypothetical protein BEN30_09440 [Magnetovibrio blakemorei]